MEVASLEAIFRALNDASVEYLVVGGLAVNAHGYQRLTVDVDLVIGLEPSNAIRALHALAGAGYLPAIPITPEAFADRQQRDQWRSEKGMVVLKLWGDLHRRTPLDVFVYEPFDFAAEYVRAHRLPVGGNTTAPVLACDTLIEMKIAAGRPKDLLDIEALRKLEPYR